MEIRVQRIQALVARGVAPLQIIEFIVREPDIALAQLRELLREMEDPYGRLADLGHRPVLLPDDDVHHALIERLKGVTVSASKNAGAQLRVSLLRTERWGAPSRRENSGHRECALPCANPRPSSRSLPARWHVVAKKSANHCFSPGGRDSPGRVPSPSG